MDLIGITKMHLKDVSCGYGGTADTEDSKSSGEIRVGSSPTIRIRLILVSRLLKYKVTEREIRP